jgi:hypothetical protein
LSLSALHQCAQCGAELRAQHADGLCTRCLLATGLGPRPESLEKNPFSGPEHSSDKLQDGHISFFGDYELLEEIARGGMGVVYRARQPRLGRLVALKMILAGPFASKQVIQRFRSEVTAAALLQHPNIVAIHDVGIQDGQHYFSMEFIEGQNLAQLVGNRPLRPLQAARYVKLVAEAIHYAHERGILHRDLKPSNVLVDASDQPRITDFGLAKHLDAEASITMSGQMLGSPNFMPPEQASSERGKVGRQSDVYGLGAILYYLLTARPPFQTESFESLITQVLHAEPVPLRVLNPSVPADLETICLKCLQKEPFRRYKTAQELVEELDRFLRDEPIHARPVTRTERTWRWCRRKPALAGLAASLVLVFTLGFAGTVWQWRKAVANRETLDQSLYVSDMSVAQQHWDRGDFAITRARLEAHKPKRGEKDRRGFEWYHFVDVSKGDPHFTLGGHSNAVNCVAFSADGKHVATGAPGGPVRIWGSATGNFIKTLPEQNVVSLSFSPDGRALAVGGRDQLVVWNLETERPVFTLKEPFGRYRITFLPTGTLLLIGKGGGVMRGHSGNAELWDYERNERRQVFRESGGQIAVSADGHRLATANSAEITQIWDVPESRLVTTIKTGASIERALSRDGQILATTDYFGSRVNLWDQQHRRADWLVDELSAPGLEPCFFADRQHACHR